ncbi:MAG: DUF333 domain-containing protein [Elusimicrobiales bacterium]
MRTLIIIAALPALAAAMPNPASVNCQQRGGRLEIRKGDAGEYGVCIFGEDRQCEEWALFRGECPAGGVDISAARTDMDKHCLLSGGKLKDKTCVYPVWGGCAPLEGEYKDLDGSRVKFAPGDANSWNGKSFRCSVAVGKASCKTLKLEGDAPLYGRLDFTQSPGGIKFYAPDSDCSGKPLRALKLSKKAKNHPADGKSADKRFFSRQ